VIVGVVSLVRNVLQNITELTLQCLANLFKRMPIVVNLDVMPAKRKIRWIWLAERTDYLEQVYCRDPELLFDVSVIIRFMQQRSEQYAADNAMLVLVHYFEEHGGCKS
jgi:hypothetical protein